MKAASSSFILVSPESHFPIQNLPYGVFRRRDGGGAHSGVAIGDFVLDLTVLEDKGFFDGPMLGNRRPFGAGRLNAFLSLGKDAWTEARSTISRLLRADEARLRDDAALRGNVLIPRAEVVMELPLDIGDYSDFYSSLEHATNVGTMLRGADKALQPNWRYLPVAYHCRASSIVVSGHDFPRPRGQTKPDGADAPIFGPTRALDFELEMGAVVGVGNRLGEPIRIAEARDHVFGLVLLNDWSARDIQAWEYVPLGPFLSKSFCTTISPWVVTLEALEPFRVAGPVQEPTPLPYLSTEGPQSYDIHLEVHLQTGKMDRPQRICAANYKHLYWSLAQQVAHHTVAGCNLRPGDLLGSGTISGPTPDSFGSLLELTWRGARPLTLPNGEQRSFLQDGDAVTLTGWAQGDGYRIGFGEATGRVLLPAV
ncbi:MAG TPA: fumarylacetoacetase [Gemmataceae bacterium]|nr:fumarylacetoacetase [Gemmataceae bacterium]